MGKLLQYYRFRKRKALMINTVNDHEYIERHYELSSDSLGDPIKVALLETAWDSIWAKIDAVIAAMGPLLLLCRLADGQKGTMSKYHGTLLHSRDQLASMADDMPVLAVLGRRIVELVNEQFEARWEEMQSDIATASYMLDPQFLPKSADIGDKSPFWRVAKKVTNLLDADWPQHQAKLGRQLAMFQQKGSGTNEMSQPGAWVGFDKTMTKDWWIAFGGETNMRELRDLALLITPLLCGSGPAERTWKPCKAILTGDRNRTSVDKMKKIVFVQKWLLKQFVIPDRETVNEFKEWEIALLEAAAAAATTDDDDDDDDDDDGNNRRRSRQSVNFVDKFESWELNAINGKGPVAHTPRPIYGQHRKPVSRFNGLLRC